MDEKTLAYYLAIATGTAAAAAQAALDNAPDYAPPVAPAPAPGDVVGGVSEVDPATGKRTEYELLADGSRREKA